MDANYASKRNSEKNEEKLLTTKIYRDFGMNYAHDKEKKCGNLLDMITFIQRTKETYGFYMFKHLI